MNEFDNVSGMMADRLGAELADQSASKRGADSMTRPGTSQHLTAREAYRQMAFTRRFEESVRGLASDGHIAGSVHLCLGQEAIPVGALSALEPDDRVLATYRGHGWALACGTAPLALMAEIAQREGGVNGGRAGSPLLSDPAHRFLGENSIVGAGVPIAAGVALANSLRGTGRLTLVSIGDGAMNQGAVTEGLVFAASLNLPLIVVCENNGWSEMTPISQTTRGEHLARRGLGLGIESFVADGGDPFAVAEAVGHAASICRAGRGPVLLELKTVRLSGHYNKDIEHYRPKTDIDEAALRDPLVRFASEQNDLTEAELKEIDLDVVEAVAELAEQVRNLPAPGAEDVFEHLYASSHVVAAPTQPRADPRVLTYGRAINQALRESLNDREDTLVYGEDVGVAGGIFGVTRGLQAEFGPGRVFDTPIAEAAILGSAVGAAIEGMRPVVEIMWADFVFVALDQIINQASNVRYVNRSAIAAPLTIRMQQGVTPGSCAQHSQSIEAVLSHIPGIKVGLPASPQDAYEMTRAAIDDPDPTVLIEHRSMYQDKAPVRFGGEIERAELARLARAGNDIGVITWGPMVAASLDAAEQLSAMGIEAAVLDLRWLRPLDDDAIDTLVRSVGGRVIIAHEATLTGGFGAEVSARIMERHLNILSVPVRRLGTPDVRMPSAPTLQAALLPSAADIVLAAQGMLDRRHGG